MKCDMCEGNESGPLCVEWCLNDVLIYEEREEEVDEEVEISEMEAGLDALIDKYGYEKLGNAFSKRLQNT
jgi:benzoyl-CoA reductase subunit BamC